MASLRVGLELELLAPPGKTRLTLARALARRLGGRVEFGFKYHGAGFLPDGRPDCRLTDAFRVVRAGKCLATFVDDPTIVDDLGEASRPHAVFRTDDVRLATWVERACWGSSVKTALQPLRSEFSARRDAGQWVDPLGHPLLGLAEEPRERLRVCEVVLPPLRGAALEERLRLVCDAAKALGFAVPAEGAVHAHYDAKPFQRTRALRRLIVEWTKQRTSLLRVLKPNPRCRKLGPFSAEVLQVARAADDAMPFSTFAAGLGLAGLHRAVDLNVLGVVERFPKQPTVEVRCLPSTLEADETLARLARVEAFIATL